jgi:hypothetical protein
MKNYFALRAPVIYRQPWVSDKLVFKLQPNDKIREEFCTHLRKSHSIRACGIRQAG